MWDKIKAKFSELKEKWLALPFFAKALTVLFPLFGLGIIWPQLGHLISAAIIATIAITVYRMYKK